MAPRNVTTMPTPTTTATVVAHTRRGDRSSPAPARRPVAPVRPATLATEDASGPITPTMASMKATVVSAKPTITTEFWPTAHSRYPTPSAKRPPTRTAGLRSGASPASSTPSGRMASTGGTRPTARAGTTAATTVAAVPTPTPTANCHGAIMNVGRTPTAMTRTGGTEPIATRPASTPITAPMTEPMSPRTSASANTTATTVRRRAPRALSVASSRRRSRAAMLTVLNTRKPPTIRASTTTRRDPCWKMWASSRASLRACRGEPTSKPGPTDACTAVANASLLVPGAARTSTASGRPGRPASVSAMASGAATNQPLLMPRTGAQATVPTTATSTFVDPLYIVLGP